ncbi:MAG TPA: hypothetical protein VFN25_05095 [Dokdonella sp.]|uniref:hypothetical protein n=1 Tax=Dokdonella sp. TaxID=2291710 RepID=UPI002D80D6C4|nr:hypothetical protein [Dokdonella sp.]HET9032265.1 hypothetical protein [Dokdonella sp.]
MVRKSILLALVLVLFAGPVAAKKAVEKVVVADTPEKFAVLVEKIHGEMKIGGRYEFMSKRDRQSVDMSFKKMSAMLESSGSVDAMPIEEKTRLFSEQEKVNGLLARNSDERLVCTHVAPVGSHIPKTTCKTVRQINQERSNSSRDMNNMVNNRLGSGPGN